MGAKTTLYSCTLCVLPLMVSPTPPVGEALGFTQRHPQLSGNAIWQSRTGDTGYYDTGKNCASNLTTYDAPPGKPYVQLLLRLR